MFVLPGDRFILNTNDKNIKLENDANDDAQLLPVIKAKVAAVEIPLCNDWPLFNTRFLSLTRVVSDSKYFNVSYYSNCSVAIKFLFISAVATFLYSVFSKSW